MGTTRHTATFLRAAMLVVPIALLAVAVTVADGDARGLAGPLLWISVLASAGRLFPSGRRWAALRPLGDEGVARPLGVP